MGRCELKRYVYQCDGLAKSNLRCPNVQVIDAANALAADNIAKSRGWEYSEERDRWLCGERQHAKSVHVKEDVDA